jgi:hypothetical protein
MPVALLTSPSGTFPIVASSHRVHADTEGDVMHTRRTGSTLIPVELVLWHEAARPDDHVQRQWAKNADLKPSNRNVDLIDRGCPKVAPVFLWVMRML